MTKQDFINAKVKKFYETLTDQVDEENGYYDSQFEGTQPKQVETFIREILRDALKVNPLDGVVMPQTEDVEKLVDMLQPYEREDLFSKYCKSCGSKDPRCQCWNDE
jgi:hypothetical protein